MLTAKTAPAVTATFTLSCLLEKSQRVDATYQGRGEVPSLNFSEHTAESLSVSLSKKFTRGEETFLGGFDHSSGYLDSQIARENT